MALWMTYYPITFFGIYQFKSGIFKGYGFGWQGIVPMKAKKMAQLSVDLMVPDVLSMEDVVSKIDPKVVSEMLAPVTKKVTKFVCLCVSVERRLMRNFATFFFVCMDEQGVGNDNTKGSC